MRFENLKIKISPFTFNHHVPKLATSIVPGKVVAIPSTLVCIRYTDEKYEKAVNSFEMFFCITSSHCKKKQRALWSKVSYDKRKQFVLQYVTSTKYIRKFYFVHFTVAATLKTRDYLSFQYCFALHMARTHEYYKQSDQTSFT